MSPRERFALPIPLVLSCLLLGSCQRAVPPDLGTAPGAPGAAASDSGAAVVYRPGEKPAPPFPLPAPAPAPDKLDGRDLRTADLRELRALATQAYGRGEYPRAMGLQYWIVQRSKAGQYNLACYCARTGRKEEALYWLQAAALEEGVDFPHAARDDDLKPLHRDDRWPSVRAFLEACTRYWEANGKGETVLVLPSGYEKGTPLPVVVWLHGLGSWPGDFVGEDCQKWADDLGVAFLGVSGTLPKGPRSFVWAEEPERDAKRIGAALAEVADRLTAKPGHLIALGFSQGAQVGLEVAVRHPEQYAGAIVMSPGTRQPPWLQEDTPSRPLAKRAFVLTCGAEEHPGFVQRTASDAAWLRAAEAKVEHIPYTGVSAHALPRDFAARFPDWVRFIEATRGE
jgi:predicted esterase